MIFCIIEELWKVAYNLGDGLHLSRSFLLYRY